MKRKIKNIVLLTIFTGLFLPLAKSQSTAEHAIETNIRENVFLVTDRDLYLCGEQIWFSASCSVENAPSSQLSNVLYVELYLNKKAVVKKKFQIVDGKVQGMLIIPEELPSANYYLRAYTQYMRNFSPETFFTTLLTLINPEIPYRKSTTNPVQLVQIVPEGGQIIAGAPAGIAVRLNKNILKTIEQSRLTYQNGNTVKTFQPAENGLALIEFTPENSQDYFLEFKLKTGDTVTVPLPKVSRTGILIRENFKNNEVNIYSGPDYRNSHNRDYLLTVYSANRMKMFEIPVTINKQKQTIPLSGDKLSQGINYLLLTNNTGKIVAFTISYRPFAEMVKINLSTQKQIFGVREPVQLNIRTGKKEENLAAGFTVSVIKKGSAFSYGLTLPLAVVDNPLLLPAFANRLDVNDSAMKRQIKTALILNRNDLVSQKTGQQFEGGVSGKKEWLPEIRDVSLSGILKNKKTNQALPGVWVYASVLGDNAQFHTYKTRENGLFIFSLNKLNNTHDVALTLDTINGVETEFLIFNDFSEKWPLAKDVPLQTDTAQRALLESMFVNDQVSKIFRQKQKVTEQLADSIPFPFSDLQTSVKLKDFIALPTMSEVFQELVPYVSVRIKKGKHYLAVINPTTKAVYDHPLILIDNLPVFNIEDILAINPDNVERIDAIGKVYSFGDLLIKGIVMIHTKTHDFAGIHIPSGSVFVEYQTITPPASVQFPVYTPHTKENGHSPDFRNLLYWNPSVSLFNNDTTITFYTADDLTGYEIIVQGKTIDGRPCFGKHFIRVTVDGQ